MTRETKIGMAVAVSFLSLVGIVVATNWRRGHDAAQNGNVAFNTKEQKDKVDRSLDNPPVQPQPKKNPVEPAEFKFAQVEANPAAKLPGGNAGESSTSNPPPAPPAANANTPVLPAPPAVPMIVNPELPSVPTAFPGNSPAAVGGDKDEAARKALLELKKQQDASLPPLPGNPFDKGDDGKNKAGNVVDNAINKGNEFAKKGFDDVNKQFPKIDDGFNRANNAGNQFAQGANIKIEDQFNKGKDGSNKGPDNVNKQLILPPPPDSNPAVPPSLAPKDDAKPMPPSLPGLPPIETKAPMIPMPKEAGLPPITNAGANNPPPTFVIPQPKANSGNVVNYDVQTIKARPGDTFTSLSRDVYKSEAYANALLAYNREFSTNRNMTAPQPDQVILFPPLQVLQQDRYARAVTDVRPTVGAAPVSIAPATPLNPNRAFTPTTPSTDVTKSYRIAAGGQKIYELAIQTLGDGSRWTEIYRLNPTIDPLQPIPGNTVVRLPANANVP